MEKKLNTSTATSAARIVVSYLENRPYADYAHIKRDPEPNTFRFGSLIGSDLEEIAKLLKEHPQSTLVVQEYSGIEQIGVDSLEFLKELSNLRHLNLQMTSLKSFDGLDYLSNQLETLALGSTQSKSLSLKPLSRFTKLKKLSIDGHSKDIDALTDLSNLEDLTLRSVKLPDLSPLLPLARLRALDIKLGNIGDISLLPRIAGLEYLEIWRTGGLGNIDCLGQIVTLKELFLEQLRQIEKLPDLSSAVSLSSVTLSEMKNLRDISQLLSAPGLEDIYLQDLSALEPESLALLANHPKLRSAHIDLGSKRKTTLAREFLPLPKKPVSDRLRDRYQLRVLSPVDRQAIISRAEEVENLNPSTPANTSK